ncbi:hypothetical protein MKC99_15225 [[Clostridium] innocuum]|nr:hypothetical protein [[Clostridium] innocuum]
MIIWRQSSDSCIKADVKKESSLLIIGNQQLKELGGFIASAYCCGIAYLYVPLTGNAALHAASHFCGVDLMGIPDVLQSCHEPRMVFLDEDIFESEHNAA